MKAITHIPVVNAETEASKSPFKVQTIHSLVKEEGFGDKSYDDDRFQIIWIVRGASTHFIDGHNCDMDSNLIFCLKPGQIHKFSFDEKTEGFVISFTEKFLNIGELEFDLKCHTDLFQLFLKTNGINIGNETMAEMREIVIKIMKENDNTYLFKNEIIKRYLKIFLIHLTRHFNTTLQPVAQSRNMEIVQSFMRLLERNFKEKKMVSYYANEIFVTANYLNEIIKKMTGYSAGHQIRQRVVLEAKRMALYSDSSMKEISYELGFLDPCHFSKFFKGFTGVNFSDFKREKTTLSLAV
jgi:AraC family transcriptional activator of pobA